jgi:hypothetical protein
MQRRVFEKQGISYSAGFGYSTTKKNLAMTKKEFNIKYNTII